MTPGPARIMRDNWLTAVGEIIDVRVVSVTETIVRWAWNGAEYESSPTAFGLWVQRAADAERMDKQARARHAR